MAKQRSFARGFNFYKVFWIFLAFSVLGWAVEMLFAPIAHGHWESRNGLLYGPISQIYGIGALLIIFFLRPLRHEPRHKRIPLMFFFGMIIGSGFEWIMSYAQEVLFGTISWDYTTRPLSIGSGRINLLFTIFWGIGALLIMEVLYPWVTRAIEKIPNSFGKQLTWLVAFLLAVDVVLSATAVHRWQQRIEHLPPANPYEVFLDTHYPDVRMRETYANMKVAKTKVKPPSQSVFDVP